MRGAWKKRKTFGGAAWSFLDLQGDPGDTVIDDLHHMRCVVVPRRTGVFAERFFGKPTTDRPFALAVNIKPGAHHSA